MTMQIHLQRHTCLKIRASILKLQQILGNASYRCRAVSLNSATLYAAVSPGLATMLGLEMFLSSISDDNQRNGADHQVIANIRKTNEYFVQDHFGLGSCDFNVVSVQLRYKTNNFRCLLSNLTAFGILSRKRYLEFVSTVAFKCCFCMMYQFPSGYRIF